jgi:predicted transcriptional regulator
MTSNEKEETRKRTEMLARLRKQHSENVKHSQALLKEQQAIRKLLKSVLQTGPCSVLQLSQATGIQTHEVLWHLTAMHKYGMVEEVGMDEDQEYYLYTWTREAQP